MVDELAGAMTDPRLASNVTHQLADLLRTNLLLTAQGWTRQGDADFLRGDPAFRVASSAQRGAVLRHGSWTPRSDHYAATGMAVSARGLAACLSRTWSGVRPPCRWSSQLAL